MSNTALTQQDRDDGWEDCTSEECINELADFIEMRAADPWDDKLWPAANTVLMAIAGEIRRDTGQFLFKNTRGMFE